MKKKTTITLTALPRGVIGAAGSGGKLRLSVFIAPRLWTTEPIEQTQILHLVDYPAFKNWPSQVSAMKFDVTFAGSPTLSAIAVSAPELRNDLWNALFPDTIPVKPFRFDNLANTPIQTIDTAYLEDWLHELYRRVGTDPAYGAGEDKPPIEIMQQDPGLAAIARPSQPEPPYEPPAKRRVPIYYQPKEPEDENRGCGCLTWLINIINCIASALGLGKPFKLPGETLLPSSIQPQNAEPELSQPAKAQTPAKAAHPTSPLPLNAANLPTAIATAQGTTAKDKFDQVVAFVQPFEDVTVIPAKLTDEELADLLDFHDGIALAADYPTLLRALGLVVDLEMDWPAGLPENGMVSIKTSSLPEAYPLCTHYTLSSERFLAAPRPAQTGFPEARDGLLRLSDESRYRIVQTDVVGAAIKVQNTATSIQALLIPGLQPANPPTEETLPSLRSAGLAVVQSDLAIQLSNTYVKAVGLNNALANKDGSPKFSLAGPHQPVSTPVPTDELWAEDVTRGYRMDVRDMDSASQKWRSLHRRTGSCQFTGVQPVIPFPVEDEGYVQLGTTEPVDGGAQKMQRVPDVITTWNGWSLSAVRPGKSLVENDKPGEAVQDVPNEETKTAFKLVTNFKPVSGSLPRLRFGHHYQLRVRTVDLAGNSVFGPDDNPHSEFQKSHPDETPPQPYRRFEPVPSPAVVLKAKPIEGESVERLVVRSAAQAGDPQQVNRPETERHIVPPKSSQLLSEHHGQFDDTNGKPNPDLATYDLATREANTLTHYWVPMVSIDPSTGSKKTVWALHPQPGVETLYENDEKKDPTFWQTKDAFPLDYFYLPDPLACQAVFRYLPGLAQNVVKSIPFDGEWPDRLPFRLKLKSIPAGQTPQPPKWTPDPPDPANPAMRVLEVELAPGEQRTVRLNSITNASDLPQLGVWGWETEPNTSDQVKLFANTALGLNWLLMPYRELYLVHATQKPLEMPKLYLTEVKKETGDTAVIITGSADVDAKTTGKVDLLALWVDPEDDIKNDAPVERKSHATIGEFNVTSPTMTSVPISQANHNLGDTKYHSVTYVARGATRFREYMPDELLKQLNVDDLLSTPTDAEITAGNLTTMIVKDVMNSARPLAPTVAYIMPTLGRVKKIPPVVSHGWKITTRTRSGSGLRVYLERPWFSSGAGELLGIVFQKDASLSDALRPYVTEWANDPIWASSTADLMPSVDNFVNSAAGPLDVTLDEISEQVRVVGYPVEFDAQKGQWFADIEFAGLNSYTPMVRLALARFQPKSVGNSFISRIVRADFVQPLPDRKLTISQETSDLLHFKVTLNGLAPALEPALIAVQSRPVQAWIEKLVSPTKGELGWERLMGDAFTPTILDAGSALWKGEFNLLKAGPYRLVIQETEPVYPAMFSGRPDGNVVSQSGASLGRTVYADTWEL